MKVHSTYCTRSSWHFTTFSRINQSAYFCMVISFYFIVEKYIWYQTVSKSC